MCCISRVLPLRGARCVSARTFPGVHIVELALCQMAKSGLGTPGSKAGYTSLGKGSSVIDCSLSGIERLGGASVEVVTNLSNKSIQMRLCQLAQWIRTILQMRENIGSLAGREVVSRTGCSFCLAPQVAEKAPASVMVCCAVIFLHQSHCIRNGGVGMHVVQSMSGKQRCGGFSYRSVIKQHLREMVNASSLWRICSQRTEMLQHQVLRRSPSSVVSWLGHGAIKVCKHAN